jgi:hypothetical protein
MHQFIITPLLHAMVVPAAQQKFLLHLFTLWLSIGGRFNYTNLGLYSPCHERTFRRGFARSFSWADFNQRLLPLMIPSHHQLIAFMDSTFITKSGKHTPQLGWFFNGSASRAEKGLEASVVAVADVTTNTAYALLARQTPSGKAPNTESRLTVYLRHLQETRPFSQNGCAIWL